MAQTSERDPLLADQRAMFEVDDQIAYFNTAALSPLLRSVRRAGVDALARRASPWTISTADWFSDVEELRSRFARLIGGAAEGIALAPAPLSGLSLPGRDLRAGRGERLRGLQHE